MVTPKSISGWFMWLFFLFAGLWFALPDFFATLGFWGLLTGLFALGYAVLSLFGK